ncbi:MAG: PP2C family protein-serine/threonine phosphatase [Acidimicrobiales bacterium]
MTDEGALQEGRTGDDGFLRDALLSLLVGTTDLPARELIRVVDVAGRVLGAESARMLIADYALTSLQELGEDGPTGARQPIDGTLAGRAFVKDEVVLSGDESALVWVPLAEGTERLGVLELTHPRWTDELLTVLAPVVRLLVLVLISKRRYTDVVLRSRRAKAMSFAAELQWDLLPPLTCSSDRVSVSGILEPAYSIGGDSFDYAFNSKAVEFAIVDAVGRGTAAVLKSVAAINSLRNARREGSGLESAYHDTGKVIATQFEQSNFATGQIASFVTGQIGTLSLDTGELTWLNAGHPLPLLVRDGTFIGELACAPSMPMGLGGSVKEIATVKLQPGDRVLFYTDGVIETRSVEGQEFGVERLADFLVRATLDRVTPAETVRRLSASILAYNGAALNDDATLLLIDYHGGTTDQA